MERNRICLPLAFDTHVHARDMEQLHKMTVMQTFIEAARSGVGTVCLMPNTSPSIDNQGALARYLNLVDEAEKATGVKGYVWVALTDTNHKNLLYVLKNYPQVIGVKVYPLKDDGTSVTTGAVGIQKWDSLVKLLDMMKEDGIDKPIAGHWEDPLLGHSIESEVSALTKLIDLAGDYKDFRFVACHLTSKAGLELVASAQAKALQIMIEITPHHLWFSADEVDTSEGLYKCFPPIKGDEDRAALREFLFHGIYNPLICIGSDSAPHTVEEKYSTNPPGGLVSMQQIIPVLLSLGLDEVAISHYTSYNAASFFALPLETSEAQWELSWGPDFSSYNNDCVPNPFKGEILVGKFFEEV